MKRPAYIRKLPNGFQPMIDMSEPGIFDRVKVGDVIQIEFSKPRNIKFHRKFFSLLNIGFEGWDPSVESYNGVPSQKSFDVYRNDIICAAGHYDVVTNLKGDIRVTAKSISFEKMDELSFERLYNDVVNATIRLVLKNYTRENLDEVIEEIIRF